MGYTSKGRSGGGGMSREGIKKFAEVLSIMQETRGELLRMGTKQGRVNKQDIRLGQLLETAKDHIKMDFTEETLRVEK